METAEPTPYTRIRDALRSGRRIPTLLQSENSECGLACLAMVASHHGQRRDVASLRRDVSVSLKGMTLAGLMKAAERIGLSGRPLRFELSAIRELATPCILHWDMNHFVVLVGAGRKRATIIDPARGRRTLDLEEVRHAVDRAETPAPGGDQHERAVLLRHEHPAVGQRGDRPTRLERVRRLGAQGRAVRARHGEGPLRDRLGRDEQCEEDGDGERTGHDLDPSRHGTGRR